jgi:hypothetical protein
MRFALVIALAGTMTALADEKPSTKERATIDFVEKSGGKGSIDPHFSPEARVLARFESVSDTTLKNLKKYPLIGGVDAFDASQCTAKGFGELQNLPHLQKLAIRKGNLKAAGVAAIGQCKELRCLTIVNAGLSDEHLVSLDKLTMLEHLTLSENPKVTDKGMNTVKGFDRLRELLLTKTSITDAGLMELKVLDGLRSLNVGGTKVTDAAAEKFADDMPNLRTVRH